MTTLSVCQCSSFPKQTEAAHSCCQVGLMQLLPEPHRILNFSKQYFCSVEIFLDLVYAAGSNLIFITNWLLPDICCLCRQLLARPGCELVDKQRQASHQSQLQQRSRHKLRSNLKSDLTVERRRLFAEEKKKLKRCRSLSRRGGAMVSIF